MSAVESLRIASDSVELTVLPGLGARLHRLRVFGHDILRTPAEPLTHARDPLFWGAYHMVPWGNRIRAGTSSTCGRDVRLATNFDGDTAIHGQVFLAPWQVEGDNVLRISAGGDGWPWTYDVRLELTAVAEGLDLNYRLTNTSDDAMPAGLGLHPWFRKPVRVAVPATHVFGVNAAITPEPEPVTGVFDLRTLGAMADDVDATWTGLTARTVRLEWPDTAIRCWLESPCDYVVAASPSHLDAVAVEPQTHLPDGLARLTDGLPGGLTLLEAGDHRDLRIRFRFSQDGGHG